MITQRAVIIGIVGGCFYLITIVNSLPSYFYVLTWLAASALASCLGIALLSLQGLGCRWRIERKSAAEDLAGQSGPVLQVELSNAGTLNKTGLILEVHLRDAEQRFVVRRFLVEALPSRAQLSSEIVLTDLPRGRYDVGDVRVVGSDVLGLFRVWKRVAVPRDMAEDSTLAARSELISVARRAREEWTKRRAAREWGRKNQKESPRVVQLLVGPATVNYGRGATGVSREAAGGESAASDLTGRGDELRGTRPYVAGDDLRSVHWKSTARLGQLVVREFDRTTRAESVVIWDGGLHAKAAPHATGRIQRRRKRGAAARDVMVEQGLRFAASLCRALTEGGKPCALLRLDSDPVFIASPKRGATSLSGQFGDALAVADVARQSALPEALAVFLRLIPPGADVFMVTAGEGESLRRAAHALQRLGTTVTVVRLERNDAGPDGAASSGQAALDYEGRVIRMNAHPETPNDLAPVRAALVATLDPRSGNLSVGAPDGVANSRPAVAAHL
jgi:uncharacterized protein (DUF58 family)